MINLADAIIQQNERKAASHDGNTPDGYYRDDMGYLVEENLMDDKERYAEYVLLRILRLHHNIYMRYGRLYCGHHLLECNTQEALELADSPRVRLNPGQTAWIFNRLKALAPEIDETKILVAEGVYWDMDKAELVDLDESIKLTTMR